MALDSSEKTQIIADNALRKGDTGSPEVQVAVLNRRIKEIQGHLDTHKMDHASRRGLLQMVGRQKRLLDYLYKEDIERYRAIVKKLGIRSKERKVQAG
jgi:small subunit ribosomal protein S15